MKSTEKKKKKIQAAHIASACSGFSSAALLRYIITCSILLRAAALDGLWQGQEEKRKQSNMQTLEWENSGKRKMFQGSFWAQLLSAVQVKKPCVRCFQVSSFSTEQGLPDNRLKAMKRLFCCGLAQSSNDLFLLSFVSVQFSLAELNFICLAP